MMKNLLNKIALITILMVSIVHAGEQTPNPCATAVPYKIGWKKAVITANKKQNLSFVNWIMLGDSITNLWGNNPKWANGADVFAKFRKEHPKIVPYNFAIPGDESQNILWQITGENLLKNIKNPKLISLMIGINSLNRNFTPKQVAGGITKIIETLKDRKPEAKILLLGVWPCWTKKHPIRGKIKEVNTIISKLADFKQVYYMDIGSNFVARDGEQDNTLLRDGIHPGAKGFEIWGKLWFPYIVDLVKNNGNGALWEKYKPKSEQ